MRSAAYFVVIATSLVALRVNVPAVSAAEDAAASLPQQVLIEAMIVEVGPDKSSRTETGSSFLDRTLNAHSVCGNGAMSTVAAASSQAEGSKPAKSAGGYATNTETIKLGWIGSRTEFMHTLEGLADIKVLATPRLLVQNKQRAEVHLGGHEVVGPTVGESAVESSPAAKTSGFETRLRFRPFVSSDGWIRLEIHLERSTGKTDANGVPQTNTLQVTSNVMIPDGATLAIGGSIDTEVVSGGKESPSANPITKKELLVILSPRIRKLASASADMPVRPLALSLAQ
jgi:type II secretory pathway component GspD/PulD (secretin)